MSRVLIIPLLALLIFNGCAHRQLTLNCPKEADLLIVQNNKAVPFVADETLLILKPEPFAIFTRFLKVNVCLSFSADDLDFVGNGIDTTLEKRSCFYSWHSFAMDNNANYLIIGSEGASSLNADHGMRRFRANIYAFPVMSFYATAAKRFVKFSEIRRPIHAAIWIDKNSDQIIDEGEYRLIDLVFSNNPSSPI